MQFNLKLFILLFTCRDSELDVLTEPHNSCLKSTTPDHISTRLPSAPTPPGPGLGFALFDPGYLKKVSPQKPLPVSENHGKMFLCIKF